MKPYGFTLKSGGVCDCRNTPLRKGLCTCKNKRRKDLTAADRKAAKQWKSSARWAAKRECHE